MRRQCPFFLYLHSMIHTVSESAHSSQMTWLATAVTSHSNSTLFCASSFPCCLMHWLRFDTYPCAASRGWLSFTRCLQVLSRFKTCCYRHSRWGQSPVVASFEWVRYLFPRRFDLWAFHSEYRRSYMQYCARQCSSIWSWNGSAAWPQKVSDCSAWWILQPVHHTSFLLASQEQGGFSTVCRVPAQWLRGK